jgi:hypothetical protein
MRINSHQIVKLRSDFAPDRGIIGKFLFAPFTGNRRSAYLMHKWIAAGEGVLLIIPLYILGQVQPGTRTWHFALIGVIAVLVLGICHGIYMILRRETYWQLMARELKANQQNRQNAKQELLQYADVLKGKSDGKE